MSLAGSLSSNGWRRLSKAHGNGTRNFHAATKINSALNFSFHGCITRHRQLLQRLRFSSRPDGCFALEAPAHFCSWVPKRWDRSDRRARCTLHLRQRQGVKFRYRGPQRWCVPARRPAAVVQNVLQTEHLDLSRRPPIARSACCLLHPRQRSRKAVFRWGRVLSLSLIRHVCWRVTRSNSLAASSFSRCRFPDESRQSVAMNSGETLERNGDRR